MATSAASAPSSGLEALVRKLGFGTETQARREGPILRVTTRGRPRWFPLLLALLAAIASLEMLALGARLEPLGLECSRAKDQCVLSGGRRTVEWFPVSEALRFEVRSGGKRTELVAVTTRESIPLLRGGRADLEDRAAELNAFLHDAARERWSFRHDPREDLRRWGLPLLVLLNALVVLLGVLWVTGRTTVFDRARRVAIRPLGPFRFTRRLDAFRSVHVRSLAEEPRPWYARGGQVQVGSMRRIVLVAEGGGAWPVTPRENPRFARGDLDAVAAELAEFLGLPVT